MSLDALKSNIEHSKKIIREIYVFGNQLDSINRLERESKVVIDVKEKKLLNDVISALLIQLKILNESLPTILENIRFFKELGGKTEIKKPVKPKQPLVQLKYHPSKEESKVSITITEKDRQRFLLNLSKSNLSIHQLKKNYAVEKPAEEILVRSTSYARISNRFFRNISEKLAEKGHLKELNKNLRKMNSQYLVGTYTSMILFTMTITFIFSLFVFLLMLFYKISILFPFLTPVEISFFARFVQIFWIVIVLPIVTGIIMYFSPLSEGKSFGAKIDQELPFITIHMSAISTSGIEPVNLFKILLKSKEYEYTNKELRKVINLINFRGLDLVTALKQASQSSPSVKLKELLGGFATSIRTGGDLHMFLAKHAEGLLADYKLEREKYIKTSETFMDIYISIVIAAPMILLMLFVIMGSTGMNFMGLSVKIMGFLIVMVIALLNVFFLIFLKLKQPMF